MTSQIIIFASFPDKVDIPLDLTTANWKWISVLTIPINELLRLDLCPKPYKWIRFAIGVVIGAKGDLCDVAGNRIDYEASAAQLPSSSLTLRYHVNDTEKLKLYPLDPQLLNARATSTRSSTRTNTFRDVVMERDDGVCLLTEAPPLVCDAVHLLAHSKDDLYIQTYTRARGQSTTDYVDTIDDPRNGIFLNSIAHRCLGREFAILVTPNFALTTADIHPDVSATESRYTSHYFADITSKLIVDSVRPGTCLRTPATVDFTLWPPTILFDASYASAILDKFASENAASEITSRWKKSYYPEGVITRERGPRYDSFTERSAPDTMDMLAMLPYIGVPIDKLPAIFQERKEKARSIEHDRIEDKVKQWQGALSPIANL